MVKQFMRVNVIVVLILAFIFITCQQPPQQPPANSKPVIQTDNIITVVDSTTLIVVKGYDSDGEIVLYVWDLRNDNSWADTISFSSISHHWPATGTYYVGVKCKDDKDDWSEEYKITILVFPDYPVLTPMKDTSVYINTEFYIYVNAYDANGVVEKYQWDFNNDSLWDTLTDTNILQFNRQYNLATGRIIINVRCYDNDSNWSEIGVINIQILSDIPIITPMNDTNVYVFSDFQVYVRADDPNRVVVKYLWDFDNDSLWDDSTEASQVLFPWQYAPNSGNIVIKVQGQDNEGYWSEPAYVYIDIVEGTREYDYSWLSLKIYFIYQDQLPLNPGNYADAKTLYQSVKEPYTFYYNEQEAEIVLSNMTTEDKVGIGIFIKMIGDTVVIRHVIENSPAEQAGLLKNDRIISVNTVKVVGVEIENLIDLLSGDEGTRVTIQVLRGNEIIDFDLIRGKFDAPTVLSNSLEDDIAYIQIFSFLASTPHISGTYGEFSQALIETEQAAITILDLRDNGGGLVDQCINICDEFIEVSDTIIHFRIRQLDLNTYVSGYDTNIVYLGQTDGLAENREFIVLVNGYTASASEILAITLRENRNFALIGSSTYGKGRGQYLIPTPENGLLRITSMLIISPDRLDYDQIGILPDIKDNGQDALDIAYHLAKERLGYPVAKIKEVNGRVKEIKFNRWQGIRPFRFPHPLK